LWYTIIGYQYISKKGGIPIDIKHFSYFTTIVECGYNLSAAAKKIHITQSALSKTISTFEQEEKVLLFYRVNGRLGGLTSAGQLFYDACVDITRRYDDMMEQVRMVSHSEKRKVKLGIPPLVVTVVFADIIASFNKHHAEIELELVEAGAEALGRRFINQEFDFAVLLAPTNINPAMTRQYTIHKDELTAFMATDHPLADRPCLTWSDLDQCPVSIFNETFSINRYFTEKIKEEKIKPAIVLKSGSWDFLMESVVNSNLITLLPSPIKRFIRTHDYVELPFVDPIIWDVVLVEFIDKKLTSAQQIFKEFVLNYTKD